LPRFGGAFLLFGAIAMPTSVTHGTLPDGSILEIGSTDDGRLEVDADFSDSSVDSFGRLRTSTPFTLFDSSHRFSDNGHWATSVSTGGSATFNASQGLVDLAVTAASGSEVIRETKRVFAYQPGKSLLMMNTVVFATAKTGLRQRVGYFGTENGIYLEQDGATVNLVLRSKVSGSVVDTKVAQSNWNGDDKLNGTGLSKITLDLSKAQIFWVDLEWLGVGTVRAGFVINGQFIHCHSFHHANLISSTYTTTACLPLRYEITNTAATSGASTMKQICSTVLSEGGYELRGIAESAGTAIGSAYSLAVAGTYYPVISVRLKSTRLDSIVVPIGGALMGVGNGHNYSWRVYEASTISGGSWLTTSADSSVEYNLSGASFSGGKIISSGYFSSSNQSTPIASIIRQALFSLQLQRNSFTSSAETLTIAVACDTATSTAYASLDWGEITR
jgi:hypothetical protein